MLMSNPPIKPIKLFIALIVLYKYSVCLEISVRHLQKYVTD